MIEKHDMKSAFRRRKAKTKKMLSHQINYFLLLGSGKNK